MPTALIVEDNSSDLHRANSVLTELGFDKIESATSVQAALRLLEDVADKRRAAPSLILLDLAFGYESGFEVLRRWKSDANLRSIKVVVWTAMGEREQELCRLFGLIYIIPKWKSTEEFKSVLQEAVGQIGKVVP